MIGTDAVDCAVRVEGAVGAGHGYESSAGDRVAELVPVRYSELTDLVRVHILRSAGPATDVTRSDRIDYPV